MEFPDDVLEIIRDFSRPVTHPLWRVMKPMPATRFHQDIARTYNKMDFPVIRTFVQNYDQIQFTYTFHFGTIARVHCAPTGYRDDSIKSSWRLDYYPSSLRRR
jgi:hypothetical protein